MRALRLRAFSLDLLAPGNKLESCPVSRRRLAAQMLFIALPVSTPLWLVPTAIFTRAPDALRQEILDMPTTRDQAVPAHS
jgi:hypothetical protein